MRLFRRRHKLSIRERQLQRQRQEVGPNGWTCHVCGDYRSDSKISVHSTITMFSGVSLQQNVRYCNDRSECREGAKNIKWIRGAENGRS
jgi:hypothetical protein